MQANRYRARDVVSTLARQGNSSQSFRSGHEKMQTLKEVVHAVLQACQQFKS